MSTLQNNQPLWKIPSDNLDSKYEKCRNITEEIYKRINITFQIKKLETSTQSDLSDHSDQIDSNELSNETDLFACDKSSISSSTELEALERGSAACEKYINNNNNEEKKKAVPIYKRPRKRFRKRVKKTQQSKCESDGSSDEALPLSKVVDLDSIRDRVAPSPSHTVMGVPNVVITPIDLKKFKLPLTEKKTKKTETKTKDETKICKVVIDKTITDNEDSKRDEKWNCTLCSMSFRGKRGLRRHMSLSHIMSPEEEEKFNRKEN